MMRRLLKDSKGYRLPLFLALVLSLLPSLTIILVPFFTGKAIDAMVENQTSYETVFFYLVIMGGLVLNYVIIRFISEYLIVTTTNRMLNEMRKRAFDHILKAPISRLEPYGDGEIIDRMILDFEVAREGLVHGLNQFFSNIFTILGMLIMMFLINIPMALLVILLTPISLIFAQVIAKRSFKAFKASANARNQLSSYTEEMVQNQKLVRNLNYEEGSIKQFDRYNRNYQKAGFKAVIYASFLNPTTRLINTIIYIAVGLLGAYLIVFEKTTESFTIGMLSSFLVYAISYTKPFNEVSGVFSQIQQAFTSFGRIFELLDLGENRNGSIELKDFTGEIEVQNLSFSYDGKKDVLKNISFHVADGERIAVVGQTGSGKTTLIQLLMRFYLYQRGSIKISGYELRSVDKMSLRKYIGIVLQDAWLFQGTVYENIAYAKDGAIEEEIYEAAKKAYADDFIQRLEFGYQTKISDEKTISLGEKQLLAIARIILLNPPLLILDEATSNIDALTEIKIQNALQELMKNKTSIVIAHRLQTIKEADRIFVMADGEIVEIGTHEALLEQKGTYFQIYESQFKNLE